MLLFLVSTTDYATVVVFLSLAFVVLCYMTHMNVSLGLPGPKRHGLLGVGFGNSDVSMSTNDATKWLTLPLGISRRFIAFETWDGQTLNIGNRDALCSVGKYE
jgi:hypothetical protein